MNDIEIDSFIDCPLIFEDNKEVTQIVVFYNLSKYGKKYVAKLVKVVGGNIYSSKYVVIKNTLEEIRHAIPQELIRMPRHELDAEEIVEIYV